MKINCKQWHSGHFTFNTKKKEKSMQICFEKSPKPQHSASELKYERLVSNNTSEGYQEERDKTGRNQNIFICIL